MHITEKLAASIRHNKKLEHASWLWKGVRPLYNKAVSLAGRSGLERVINGTDTVLVMPKHRAVTEEYEPDVWRALMAEVKSGDVVADVGTFIGLYTIALAKRVAPAGKVIAFEPHPINFADLKEHVRLNSLAEIVEPIEAAIGANNCRVSFQLNSCESHIASKGDGAAHDGMVEAECVTLDSVFAGKRCDLIKIDVEGYEEQVLQGASALLDDKARSPRAIFIEVHPHLWSPVGTTSESLIALLSRHNYRVEFLNGSSVERIVEYGEVVAYKTS
ncbi:MAG TPA: FkbM family methyltransferase [Pyrinomonadaceae bacterium]|nr:FkbM family methyltransferase [Pyrinomonadaceae bacterium]